ncbi:MAG: DUF5107 domain-containing protein, partial [Microbacterium sp.]
ALLETAIGGLTRRNLNPRDGEALYLLGLVRERQGAFAEADERFARAAWNIAWAAPSHLARARLALRAGRPRDALLLAEQASSIPEARRLAVLALRALGRDEEALSALQTLRTLDPLDAATSALAGVLGLPTDGGPADPRTTLDVAAEFARAGAFAEALAATAAPGAGADAAFGNAEPLRRVLRAAWADAAGDPDAAAAERAALAPLGLDLAFPAGLDQYDALTSAVTQGGGAPVLALRGMWLLDAARDDDALTDLAAATEGGIADPVAWRNLALAIMRTSRDTERADAAYARALELSDDGRLVFERDLLRRLAGTSAAERLALLEAHAPLLDSRDDLALAHVSLLLDADRVDDAWRILTVRTFRPFEGGEGQVIAAYDRAACAIARRLIAGGDAARAVELLQVGLVAPANLGEGRHPAVPQAERLVLLGDAFAALGDETAARRAWEDARASTPLAVAERPVDESDRFIALAHVRLGDHAAAAEVWQRLDERADELERAKDDVDYFATSLPELLVFDTDTAAARSVAADALRAAAADGRSLAREAERMEA